MVPFYFFFSLVGGRFVADWNAFTCSPPSPCVCVGGGGPGKRMIRQILMEPKGERIARSHLGRGREREREGSDERESPPLLFSLRGEAKEEGSLKFHIFGSRQRWRKKREWEALLRETRVSPRLSFHSERAARPPASILFFYIFTTFGGPSLSPPSPPSHVWPGGVCQNRTHSTDSFSSQTLPLFCSNVSMDESCNGLQKHSSGKRKERPFFSPSRLFSKTMAFHADVRSSPSLFWRQTNRPTFFVGQACFSRPSIHSILPSQTGFLGCGAQLFPFSLFPSLPRT